jgi:excisionase family DNA binding protein
VPHLTISEAARETGKGKTTVWRAIKSGRLSATRGEGGEHLIDPAELARAFPPEPPKERRMERDGTAQAVLEAENIQLRERLAETKERLEDALRQRDRWQEEAAAVRLLTAPPAKPGLLQRLIGRG